MSAWRTWYYDRQGQPIDMDAWGLLHDDEEYKRVGLDTYPSLEDIAADDDPLDTSESVATISTVWLGINHSFGGGLAPIIFETMIFGGDYDGEMTRYATEEAAAQGHSQVMEDLREGRAPWWLEDEDDMATQLEDDMATHTGGDDGDENDPG